MQSEHELEPAEDHAIHAAAAKGRLRRLRALLDADPSLLERRDRAGGTPLHRAVIGRSRRAVALLLDRGADIHAIHQHGLGSACGYAPGDMQAIDLAIWGWPQKRNGRVRDVKTARLLLARGAAHDLPTAAALGDRSRVRAILDAEPARISESRPDRRRALSAAVEFRHDAIVRLLLERGADPTWPDADDSARGAALHCAARRGDRALVELLLRHGADPNGFVDAAGNAVCAAKTRAIRALLIAHGGMLDPYDLVWLDEDDEVMRRVTEDPASAHAGCGGVYTAVVTRGKRKLLKRLLDAGITVPPAAGGCQSYLLERPDMLRELLARGGLDPNYPTPDGATLLHALCHKDERGRTLKRRTQVAAILLDAGAAIAPADRHGRTPLQWAERSGLADMVKFLRARGAQVSMLK